jgi:hypothetical protein
MIKAVLYEEDSKKARGNRLEKPQPLPGSFSATAFHRITASCIFFNCGNDCLLIKICAGFSR